MSLSNRCGVVLFLLYFIIFEGAFAEYKTVYVEDTCKTNETVKILLGANKADTAQIIKATRKPTSLPNRNCSIYILPPLGHGVTLSIRFLNMNPSTEPTCDNYIMVKDTEKQENDVVLCGHSDDPTEFESYSRDGRLELLFHTSEADRKHLYFTFVVTTFVNHSKYCPLNWLECDNNHCIWKGLACDGHNNCGDQSDERHFSPFNCGRDGAVAIIVGISLGSLLLFLVVIVLPLIFICMRLKNQRRALDEERRMLYANRNDGTIGNRQHISDARPSYSESNAAGNGTYQN